MRQNTILVGRDSGIYRMHYREWGAADNPRVLICAHGLTRNGRDFETLAAQLAQTHRVVAPDVVGRGESDWLRDPTGYQLPLYVQDMLVLLARLDVEQVDWLGTSMGGLIGMALAALPGSPLRRLLLNDVGPLIAYPALQRIADYVGNAPQFASREQAQAYIRLISTPFGPHSEAQWAQLAQVMLRQDDATGQWCLNYDPAIALPFRQQLQQAADIDLWPLYERIRCPVLLVRGAQSDLLSAQTAQAMCERGPRAQYREFAGVGHAPTFLQAEQIACAADFFA